MRCPRDCIRAESILVRADVGKIRYFPIELPGRAGPYRMPSVGYSGATHFRLMSCYVSTELTLGGGDGGGVWMWMWMCFPVD